MVWDKKNDRAKLNNLFAKRKYQGGLDFRRKDRDYIEAARAKHFPTVNSKNFVPIYNRKASKIDVEHMLKGVRNITSKLVYYSFNRFMFYFHQLIIIFVRWITIFTSTRRNGL